jgi:uncharacterized protein YdaU (DUF1376 family)
MAKEKAPAFQFYPKDFLTDGKQASMTNAEAGVYTRLLCVCWLEGSIPDDVARAGRIVGETPAVMRRMWPAVRACFTQSEPGRLRHKRLDEEREKQAERSRQQAKNGRNGGRPKANGNPLVSRRKATGVAKESSSSPSPLQNKNPPNPPAGAGGRLTRRELAQAEKDLAAFIASQPKPFMGPLRQMPADYQPPRQCPHDQECTDRETCVTLLALARRAKVQTVATAFGVGAES